MTTPTPPTAVARFAVGLAARLLPTPADRRRYQAEFVAELHGLSLSGQLRHATGVLARTPALRATLGGSSTSSEEVAVYSTTARQRFRCRYLRWHHWKGFSDPDGGRYVACAVCRKEHGWYVRPGSYIGGV